MKSLFNTTCFSIILVSLMLITSNIFAASNSNTSDDQWIAFCLTTQDAGKDTDECLEMGGIIQSQQKQNRGFKILPPEVTKELDISLAPASRPTPLIIGHYWRCIQRQDSDFESCEPVLVICTDDQSWCVETP